jgi:hypothetical protein
MPDEIADPLLAAFDEVVTAWPEVHAKAVFGHRGYVRGSKMFAFLLEGAVSVKMSDDAALEELYAREGVEPFSHAEMPMRAWPVLPLREDPDLDEVVEQARRSYEAAG